MGPTSGVSETFPNDIKDKSGICAWNGMAISQKAIYEKLSNLSLSNLEIVTLLAVTFSMSQCDIKMNYFTIFLAPSELLKCKCLSVDTLLFYQSFT